MPIAWLFRRLSKFDRNGEPLTFEFCRGVIRSAERMTYTNVHT